MTSRKSYCYVTGVLGAEGGGSFVGRTGGGVQAGRFKQAQAQVLIILQESCHRTGQGTVRSGQPPGRVAQDQSD